MKSALLPLFLCLATVPLAASDVPDDSSLVMQSFRRIADPDSGAPKIDSKRIINESSSFLKEREPDMNAEEDALYQKVVAMLTTQPDFAIKLLEAMMNDKEPPSPAFEYMLGNAYYAAGQMDKSEEHYRGALKKFPTFIRAWNNLGVLYYAQDKYSEAAPCFSKAITLGDHDPTTFGLLGYCLEHTGNSVGAEMSYLQAMSGSPENTDWMEGLLRVYTKDRQYGRAESVVRNLLKLRPNEALLWQSLANIMRAENRKLEAIIVLESAAGAGFAGIDELTQLADLYADQGLNAEAAVTYEKIMTLMPEVGGRMLLRFAQVLITTGKLDQAEQVLGRFKAGPSAPGQLTYLQTKADLFAARKKWPEARAVLQELLQSAPLNGRALLSLGNTYLGEDDSVHAAFAFEAASQIHDVAYRADVELANLELKARHYEKCADYLQKALGIEHTEAVEDYLTRVKTLVSKAD